MLKWYIRLAKLPMSYFGIALGLSGLSLSWRYASSVGVLPVFFWHVLSLLAVIIWVVLLFGYVGKWMLHQPQAQEELRDKVLCCFASLIPITLMLVGVLILPISFLFAQILIVVGTLLQLLFAAYRNAGLWRGTHEATATTPIVYLPSVASNFVSCIGFSQLGYTLLPWLFFGAGMFSWLSIESAILQRLRNLSPIVVERRTILGIQLAPAFVAGNAYLQLQQGQIDAVLLMFIGYGLLQFLYLIRLYQWIFEGGITMGSWAFSFGLAAMANLGLHLAIQSQEMAITWLGWGMWFVGNLLIMMLLLISVITFVKLIKLEARVNNSSG